MRPKTRKENCGKENFVSFGKPGKPVCLKKNPMHSYGGAWWEKLWWDKATNSKLFIWIEKPGFNYFLGWETRLCEGVLKFTRKWIFIQVLKLPGCHVQLANKSEYLKGNYSRLPGPKIGIDSELKGGVKKKFPRPFPIEQASTKLIKLNRTEKTNLILQEDKVQEVLSLDQKVECWSFVNNFHSVDLLLRLWLV